MKEISVSSLFDLNNTIAGELFEGKENAYEVLPLIHDFILKLGETLPKEKFEKKGENIWIAKSAKVAETASIPVRLSLMKKRKSAIVLLSAAMPLWGKMQ